MSRAVLRPVAAVVTDDRDAVRTIRYAARLARAAQRPLLLLVTLPGTGPPCADRPRAPPRRHAEPRAVRR